MSFLDNVDNIDHLYQHNAVEYYDKKLTIYRENRFSFENPQLKMPKCQYIARYRGNHLHMKFQVNLAIVL